MGLEGYGFSGEIVSKSINNKPVKYWVKNPTGYPYQVRLRFRFSVKRLSREVMASIRPVHKDELTLIYGIYFINLSISTYVK